MVELVTTLIKVLVVHDHVCHGLAIEVASKFGLLSKTRTIIILLS
jgi:hypothetical protein